MTNTRSLHFDPADARPDSALFRGPWSIVLFVGGLAGAIAIPLVFVVLVAISALISMGLAGALDIVMDEEERELLLEEDEVIQARFVRLGREFEELPNRVVPVLATAPPPPSEVPSETPPPSPEPPPEPVEQPSPNAVADLLTRLDDRAELFEEMAQREELEGSADGIEEGTESEGTEGDIYRGRLYSFFRRGWTIPTTVSREEAQRMTATVRVEIGADLQIVSFEIRASSGDPLFDESVLQQLTRLQAADQRIPPPPPDVAAQYIGQAIVVRFNGRQAG